MPDATEAGGDEAWPENEDEHEPAADPEVLMDDDDTLYTMTTHRIRRNEAIAPASSEATL